MQREDDNTPFSLRESPITDCIGLGKHIFLCLFCSFVLFVCESTTEKSRIAVKVKLGHTQVL